MTYTEHVYPMYKNISLQFTDKLSIIMMSFSGVMLSGISATIFLFIKYSETPIIKSSNIHLSFVQLTAQFFIVTTNCPLSGFVLFASFHRSALVYRQTPHYEYKVVCKTDKFFSLPPTPHFSLYVSF